MNSNELDTLKGQIASIYGIELSDSDEILDQQLNELYVEYLKDKYGSNK